jgi:hypothetical protein
MKEQVKDEHAPTAKTPTTTDKVKKVWEVFRTANMTFAKKRPGLVFSFIFFLALAIFYLKGIKLNEHLSDKEYVKYSIEKAEPVKQIQLLNKFSNGEDFNIERNFLTNTIHVKPSTNFKQYSVNPRVVTRFYNSYGLQDDTVAYVYLDEKWEKLRLPFWVPRPSEDNFFNKERRLIYGEDKLVYYDSNRLVEYAPNNFDHPAVFDFNPSGFVSLNEGGGDIYFTDGFFSIPIGSDSIKMLPVHHRRSYKKSDPNEDTVTTFPLPKHVSYSQLYQSKIYFSTHTRDSVSMYSFNPFNLAVAKEIPDTVLKGPEIGGSHYWQLLRDSYIFYNSQLHLVLSITNIEGPTFLKNTYKNGKEYFIANPTILVGEQNILWLVGSTNLGYGVAKINPAKKSDSLRLMHLPGSESAAPSVTRDINVNTNGLAIIERERYSSPSEFKFYKSDYSKSKLDTFNITSIVDPSIVNELAAYQIHLPPYSSNFELIASKSLGISVDYQIIAKRGYKTSVIKTIEDETEENDRTIFWPTTHFYDVDPLPDYFFTVILIISIILLYFFGLFYVMDFKNRHKAPDIKETTVLDNLPTLKEKLDQTKRSMSSLKLRSEVMLLLGIVIGVAGMLAFVASLKTFFNDTKSLTFGTEFTVRMLRTFAIFSFMEVFSFYFLKQYRITFNEYKRFYSLYLRITNFCQYIEVTQNYPDNEATKTSYKEMRDAILKDVINMHDESNLEKVNEFDKSVASDIVKSLAGKIPDAK